MDMHYSRCPIAAEDYVCVTTLASSLDDDDEERSMTKKDPADSVSRNHID
jgi:hypothetical protein